MNSRYHVFNVYHEVIEDFNDKVLVICTRNVENTPWGGDAYGESVDFLYKDTTEYSNYFESIKGNDSEYFYANRNDFERKLLRVFRTPETYLVHRSLREDAINQQELIKPVDLGLSVYWSDRNWGQDEKNVDGTFYMYDEIDSALRGSSWRLPTKAEFEELISLAPKDYSQRKRYDMTFKSRNGSSITLPTPGVMVRGELHYIDEKGSYIGTNGSDAYSLDISMNRAQTRYAFKNPVYAYLIRAVKEKA